MILLPNETYNCIPFDYNPIILSDVIFDYNPINGEIVPEGGIKLKLTQLEGGSSILTKELFHYGQIDANLKISEGVNVISSFYIESEDKNQIMFNMVNNKNNIIIETNFFYKGNAVIGSARYYYPNEILSETYNKYSILWLPDYYEWRFNNLLIRRLYKNQTANFPDSPSIVKFSISTEWKNEGIVWSQTPFEYAIKSVKLQCPITFILNDTITYKEKVQNYSNKNNLSTILLFVVFGISMMTI
jgi:beta-glucanase (GH16 family)